MVPWLGIILCLLYSVLDHGVSVMLVYGARLFMLISGVRLSHLCKSPLWWAYLGSLDVLRLLKCPIPSSND